MTKTFSISEHKAATLFSADGLEIPAGVTAKYVTVEGNENSTGPLTYTKINNIIPAGTAVVLTGEQAEYEFKVNTTEVDPITGNILFGYANDTEVAGSEHTSTGQGGNVFALANKSQGVGFYPFAGTTYTAGKAYLDITNLSAAAEARFFNIFNEDNETAIESIEGTDGAENAAIYDLSGRRVQNAQKGMYIMNGKIIVK